MLSGQAVAGSRMDRLCLSECKKAGWDLPSQVSTPGSVTCPQLPVFLMMEEKQNQASN